MLYAWAVWIAVMWICSVCSLVSFTFPYNWTPYLILDVTAIRMNKEELTPIFKPRFDSSLKRLEVWKAISMDDYPLNLKQQENNTEGMSTRADTSRRPIEIGRTALTQKTSVSASIYLWNWASKSIIESKTLHQAKKEIKVFAKSLPI